jgi:VWFA-related protein
LLDPGDVDPSIQTLKVAVRRVVVDVVVTDAKGQPVEGLTADDFKVFENGKPQAMRSFDAHDAKPEPPLQMPKLPPNTFTNIAMGPQGGPVTVILYDLLNTPLDAQPYAHEQLLKFLKKRAVSGQVAIFVLGDKLHMLQGFTDDETALIAALNATGPHQSGLLQGSNQSDLASQGSRDLTETEGNANGASDTSARGAGNDAAYTAVLGMLKHMETAESSFQLDRRVDITIDALDEIARFLIGLPGRKNLLWMSGSFPAGIIPNPDLSQRDSFEVTRNYSATMMRATDLLSLAHISVYPVDVRGLQVNPMFSAASNQTFEPGQGKDLKAMRDFNTSQTSEHASMDVIAEQTGGHAFYNTNGLTEAATAAVQQGAIYYTFSYSPTDTRMDGGLRKVRVDLDKPGLQLAYRRSYFADNLDARVDAAEDTPSDPLAIALEHGAPASHELFIEAQLQVFGPPVPATPGQMKVLAQYEAMTAHAKHNKVDPEKLAAMKPIMMQRYAVVYGLLTRQLTLDQGEDGLRHGAFDFAMMSFNDDGLKLNGIHTKVEDAVKADRYADMEAKGYRMIQVIAVPVQAASIRLAVRDAATGRIGSLEAHLPLKPTPPPAAAQATTPPAPTSSPAPSH